MPILHVRSAKIELQLEIAAGESLRDRLDATELRVRAACGGTGACGACVVRLIEGEVNPPTLAEYQKLTAEERAQGLRLACQVRARGDVEIALDHPAPPSRWHSIPQEDLLSWSAGQPALERHIYGLAVDLGTTHIRIALWDRKRGKRIATRRGPNPQGLYGADVLNRLDAVRQRPERAREFAKLARVAIIQALRDILARDVGEVTPMLAEIGHVLIVGNTAMLALLTGHGGAALLDPDNWHLPIDCNPPDSVAWHEAWFMPNARIDVPAPLAGFVGSDLLADLIACDLTAGPPGSLLLDVGTNTEIALWDGARVHVTSVPGGPAYEGGGLRFGMPAEPGAICRVRPAVDGSAYVCTTIAGSAVRGICGSGLIDAIALLLADGHLKPNGRFVTSPGEGYRLDPASPRSAIAGGDVDAFQRAKAATAAAMAELLGLAGLGWADLTRLCVCGAFGQTLDIAHAQALGLLPQIDPARVELRADASLSGCERALLAAQGVAPFAETARLCRLVNLSELATYDDRYIRHLRLQPVPPVQ